MDDVLIHSSIFDHLWGYKKLPCSPDVSPPRSGIPQGQSLWVAAGTSDRVTSRGAPGSHRMRFLAAVLIAFTSSFP